MRLRSVSILTLLSLLGIIISCNKKKETPLFQLIETSGINFDN
jgi:hypothetical protein